MCKLREIFGFPSFGFGIVKRADESPVQRRARIVIMITAIAYRLVYQVAVQRTGTTFMPKASPVPFYVSLGLSVQPPAICCGIA